MATTTNYGWTTPDNTSYVKDGASAIRTLGSSIDTTLNTINNGTAKVGLHLVNTTSIAAQTSVSISNVFSATYDNYHMVLDCTVAGSNSYVTMQLAGSTTAVYDYMGWETFRSGGTPGSGTNTGGAQTHFRIGNFYTQGGGCSVELYRPFLTGRTAYTSNSATTNADGSGSTFVWGGMHRTAASYTGMTLLADSALTGTLRIYGYRNS